MKANTKRMEAESKSTLSQCKTTGKHKKKKSDSEENKDLPTKQGAPPAILIPAKKSNLSKRNTESNPTQVLKMC